MEVISQYFARGEKGGDSLPPVQCVCSVGVTQRVMGWFETRSKKLHVLSQFRHVPVNWCIYQDIRHIQNKKLTKKKKITFQCVNGHGNGIQNT